MDKNSSRVISLMIYSFDLHKDRDFLEILRQFEMHPKILIFASKSSIFYGFLSRLQIRSGGLAQRRLSQHLLRGNNVQFPTKLSAGYCRHLAKPPVRCSIFVYDIHIDIISIVHPFFVFLIK